MRLLLVITAIAIAVNGTTLAGWFDAILPLWALITIWYISGTWVAAVIGSVIGILAAKVVGRWWWGK